MNDITTKIIEVCLLAGKIMLQSGAETYRVEDTMMRIASAYGMPSSNSYVTPTGILFSTDSLSPAKIIRISERTTDLHKVSAVNNVSRMIGNQELNPSEAYHKLKDIECSSVQFSVPMRTAAAALASGCFTIMFQGQWVDFLPAILCGGAGYTAVSLFQRLVQVRFFSEFIASFIIGLLSLFLVYIGAGKELDKIIIGSVMPLVPGLAITNAIRDLMAGHLVSGLSKGADAFLTAFAIGAGVAVVFTLM
ncbi:threonine/serine exporter family protein [Paenibacillus polygoni]|uniref:Threonine/serine exporter family protein n=1 Tax=Paenibacillus polygoni TaxID=3050112 RepID=A0ABY8X7I4_9BACL|nr:threonine/serine exporter family protein [Paenibacillus polygoni]WIV21410.1 threonine/serine exporter family protein [Paenibacillus polygoni]